MSDKTQGFGVTISTSLVVGTMIGSGIFLLPVSLANYGIYGMVGWLISALGAMALAFTFANLSRWRPGLGGPYYYSRSGIGDFPGFFVAWGYWISCWTGMAGVSIAGASYLSLILPGLVAVSWGKPALAILFVWLFTYINLRGVKSGGETQLITTLLKTIPLILFIMVGIFFADWEQSTAAPQTDASLFSMILASTALWLWAFLGVETATIPAENIKDPKRTIPIATYFGVTLVAVIYVLAIIVINGVMTPAQLQQSSGPFADAAGIMLGNWAVYVMIATAVFSTLGTLNSNVLIGAQIIRAPANDGLLFRQFGALNNRGAPSFAIILSAILTTILILLNMSDKTVEIFEFTILLSTTSLLVPYIFCAAAVFRLQPKEQQTGRIYAQLIFGFAFLFSMWALGGSGKDALYWGFLLMMASVPIYVASRAQHNKENMVGTTND